VRDAVRLSTLGSTPNRLRALLAGECDATMLNAGNELLAEAEGCALLGRVGDVCAPYVGTVVCVAGEEHLGAGRALVSALRRTTEDVLAGRVDDVTAAAAEDVLGLSGELALRFVERLKDPRQGLIGGEGSDLQGLAAVVGLRRRYLARETDGGDVLEGALDPDSGLVDRATGR
jgi:hypothetical protein